MSTLVVAHAPTPLRRRQARATATTRRHRILALGQLAALLAAQRVARVFLGLLYDKVGRSDVWAVPRAETVRTAQPSNRAGGALSGSPESRLAK